MPKPTQRPTVKMERNGNRAVVNDSAVEFYRAKGYEVVTDAAADRSPGKIVGPMTIGDDPVQHTIDETGTAPVERTAWDEFTIGELRQFAAEAKVKGSASMKKADLVAALDKAEAEGHDFEWED